MSYHRCDNKWFTIRDNSYDKSPKCTCMFCNRVINLYGVHSDKGYESCDICDQPIELVYYCYKCKHKY